MVGNKAKDCPLCLEVLEVEDFFPCACNFQVCRFCWHILRTDGHGLCPLCRKVYPKNPANFTPISEDKIAALKAKKCYRDQQCLENQKYLAHLRVLQKNLILVTGLPVRLAKSHILKRYEYFGQYGDILKIIINMNALSWGEKEHEPNAFITYSNNNNALRAIRASKMRKGKLFKTNLGTNKYCSQFIKNLPCAYIKCIYLHDLDLEASFTKKEMIDGKHREYENKLLDTLITQTAKNFLRTRMHNEFFPLINLSDGLQAHYISNQIKHFYHSDLSLGFSRNPNNEAHAKLHDYQALQQCGNDLYETNGDIERHELLDDKIYEPTVISNSISRATPDDDLDFDPFEEAQKAFAPMENHQQNPNQEYKKYRKNLNQKFLLPSSSTSNKNAFDIGIPSEQKGCIKHPPYFNVNNTASANCDFMIQQEISNTISHQLLAQQQQYGENIGMVYDWPKMDLAMVGTSETFVHSLIGVHVTNDADNNMNQHVANPMNYIYVPCLTNTQFEHIDNNQIHNYNAPVGSSRNANMIPYTGSYNIVHSLIDIPEPIPMPIQNQWHSFQNIPPKNGSTNKWWHY